MSSIRPKKNRKNFYVTDEMCKKISEEVERSGGNLSESFIVDMAIRSFLGLPHEARVQVYNDYLFSSAV
jgi:hypothetical protein